jgi:hypothetical protein
VGLKPHAPSEKQDGDFVFAKIYGGAMGVRREPVKLKKYHDFSFQCDDAVRAEAAL